MPHATVNIEVPNTNSSKLASKPKHLSRENRQLHQTLANIRTLYTQSILSKNLSSHIAYIHKTSKRPIRKILSLGLGSITAPGNGQSRRLKQLIIFLALKEEMENITGSTVELYAQDPVFSRADEKFLLAYEVRILRTSSGSSLGEAAAVIDEEMIVYSPFLTLEAYEALLLLQGENGTVCGKPRVNYLIGDDFNALEAKWPKRSDEHRQVERLIKGAVRKFKRRVVSGEGFWIEGDGAFRMAVYVQKNVETPSVKARI